MFQVFQRSEGCLVVLPRAYLEKYLNRFGMQYQLKYVNVVGIQNFLSQTCVTGLQILGLLITGTRERHQCT